MTKTDTAAALLLLSLSLPALPAAAQQRRTQPAKPAAAAPAAKSISAAASAATSDTPTDRTELDRTAIVGNRELPKVLYIVPWKKPLPATLSGRPVASVLDEALAPVDRDVFRRHMAYDAQLTPKSASPALSTAPALPAPEPQK